MNPNPKKGKVQGSVLLTVVGVMMVMVLFLMTTLTLTNAAQRRAYYTYFETQAQFAAQAALEAITNDAYSDGGFFNYVKTGGDTIEVNFDDTNIPVAENAAGHKVVTCTIEKLAADDIIWDTKIRKLESREAWKITATAAVGTGKNRSEYTCAYYLYNAAGTTSAPNSVTWSTVTKFETTGDPGDPGSPPPSPFKDSTKDGCVTLNGGGSDNMSGFGSTVMGAYRFPLGRTVYGTETFHLKIVHSQWYTEEKDTAYAMQLSNDGKQAGDMVLVNGAYLSGNDQYFQIKNGQGLVVMGDLGTQNYLFAYSNSPASEAVDYKSIPYVYVDGTISGQQVTIGYNVDSSKKPVMAQVGTENASPTNLYAGSISTNNWKFSCYGDVYLYDPALESTISPQEGMPATTLTQFVRTNVTKTNGAAGCVGGDFICNNRLCNLDLTKGFKLGGDMIMSNPVGKLNFTGNGNAEIQGALVIAGAVTGTANLTVTGGVYVLPGSTFSDGTLTVNGQVVGNSGGWVETGLVAACTNCKEKDANGTLHDNSDKQAFIETLNVNVENCTSYADTVAKIKTAAQNKYSWTGHDYKTGNGDYVANYDYSLIPFCSRLDEIFERYIRWDVRGTDTKPGFADKTACDNFISSKSDALIKESMAAGHVWESVAKTCTEYGVRYFPSTTPADKGGGNKGKDAFIPELETLNETDIVANYTYFDTLASLLTQYGMTVLPDYTKNASTAGADSSGDDYEDVLDTDGNPVYEPAKDADGNILRDDSGNIIYTENKQRKLKAGILPAYVNTSKQNVTIYNHTAAGLEPTTTPTVNAYVVNTSCMVNCSSDGGCGATGDVIFIDPTFENHNAENPLIVALYGAECRPTIVINNTAEYTTMGTNGKTSYVTGKSYASETAVQQKHAGRTDVVIYFMGDATSGGTDSKNFGAGGAAFTMLASGCYTQYANKVIDFVQDVKYPGEAGWSALPAKDKYKFELIPNDIIFAHKGFLNFQNDGVFYGAIVAPTTNVAVSSTNGSLCNITYRLAYSDAVIGMDRYIGCIGSVFTQQFSAPNLPLVVYAGPVVESSGTGTPPTEGSTLISVTKGDGSSYSSDNYLNNDHMSGS